MRHFVILCLVLAGCSKKADSGLPPASDWNAGVASGAAGSPLPGGMADEAPAGGEGPQAGTAGGAGGDGQQLPDNHPMVAPKGPAKTLAKNPDGTLQLGPFAMKLPDGWTEVPTTSEMRTAEFTFGDADLIVYYFGKEGAGSIDSNIDRWVGQFSEQDGKPKIEKVKVAGQDATTLVVSGHYTAMAMPGAGSATDKTGQEMLGMIVASPSGPYYFKLVGSKATIDANAAKWKALLDSLKVKS